MFHVLPFAVGLLVGAVAVRMVKPAHASCHRGQAPEQLPGAAVSAVLAFGETSARPDGKQATPSAEAAKRPAAAKRSSTAKPSRKPTAGASARKDVVKPATQGKAG